MEQLANLTNIVVNLDSQTAQKIATQYITYKYAEQALCFTFIMVITILITMAVRRMIKDL